LDGNLNIRTVEIGADGYTLVGTDRPEVLRPVPPLIGDRFRESEIGFRMRASALAPVGVLGLIYGGRWTALLDGVLGARDLATS